jgi:hypothetical protein
MTITVALAIIELALSLAKGNDAAKILIQIIGKAVQAYQDQTGKPLDPSLIKAEEPV